MICSRPGIGLKRLLGSSNPEKTLGITEDEPDNRILECAAEAGSELIVSEDRDLLRLKKHGNARIIR
jgi:predicted nucleic acid-binding protein